MKECPTLVIHRDTTHRAEWENHLVYTSALLGVAAVMISQQFQKGSIKWSNNLIIRRLKKVCLLRKIKIPRDIKNSRLKVEDKSIKEVNVFLL